MNCTDFREIVDSYLCDELSTETNHEVLRHLDVCAGCRSEIQSRRNLRTKLKFAIKNVEHFQISDEFYRQLLNNLKQKSKTRASPKIFARFNKNSWLAIAAGFFITFGLGFWFIQYRDINPFSSENIVAYETAKKASLEYLAAGDHRNCAVKFNLDEEPIDIDLASAHYTNLREFLLKPLQNSSDKYEFLESHTCKFKGKLFTHIVYNHQGKTVSILLTDLQNFAGLEDASIEKTIGENYQIARFDMENQAVFVVSDLPEKENTATAEMLAASARGRYSPNESSKLNMPIALRVNF